MPIRILIRRGFSPEGIRPAREVKRRGPKFMGRTVKDQRRQQTSRNTYEIVRRQDGSFDIFHNGELADRSIPQEWLADQLSRYGICGEEFKLARQQLEESGKAEFVY